MSSHAHPARHRHTGATHTQELPRVVDDEPVAAYRMRRRGSAALGGMVLLLALVLIVVGTAITTYALGL